jgi:hypothetical protein
MNNSSHLPHHFKLIQMSSCNFLNCHHDEIETEQTPMDHSPDPSIIQDLGSTTANLLASTNISQLKEAKQLCNFVGHDSSHNLLSRPQSKVACGIGSA